MPAGAKTSENCKWILSINSSLKIESMPCGKAVGPGALCHLIDTDNKVESIEKKPNLEFDHLCPLTGF